MRHSAHLGLMLAPLLAITSIGAPLNNTQQARLDKLISMLPANDGKTRRGKHAHLSGKRAKRSNRANISARVKRRHRRS